MAKNKLKDIIFRIAVIYSVFITLLFLPQRIKNDIDNMKFSITDGTGYVFFEGLNQSIPKGSYVIVEDPQNVDPYSLALFFDKNDLYLGAVELRKGWKNSIEAEKVREKKTLFFRVHMLKKGEYDSLKLNKESFFLRLRRAVLERSIDSIVFKNTPDEAKEYAKERLEKFFKGFIIDRPHPYIAPNFPLFWIFFGLVLFLFSINGIFGIAALVLYPFFPSEVVSISAILSMIAIYKRTRGKVFLSFLSFLLLGILVDLSLSDFNHLNQLDSFRFVKVSLTFLPALVFIKGLLENTWIFKDKKAFYTAASAAMFLTVYYVYRSGNYSIVPQFERSLRDFLDEVFIIRPRFKEVFGYIFLPHFSKGRSKWGFIWEFFSSIALSSTFNTFCHIKAPIFVSIYRSFLAFFLGILFYFVLAFFLKYIPRGEKR